MGNPYHGKIDGVVTRDYCVIAMRTARQRYSLRVYGRNGLISVLRYGSRATVLEELNRYSCRHTHQVDAHG